MCGFNTFQISQIIDNFLLNSITKKLKKSLVNSKYFIHLLHHDVLFAEPVEMSICELKFEYYMSE